MKKVKLCSVVKYNLKIFIEIDQHLIGELSLLVMLIILIICKNFHHYLHTCINYELCVVHLTESVTTTIQCNDESSQLGLQYC